MISDLQVKINGTAIDLVTTRFRMNSLQTWSKDAPPAAAFTVESMLPQTADPWANARIEIFVDPDGSGLALAFFGYVEKRVENLDDRLGWTYGYQASGIEYVGHRRPVKSPFDGTGSVTFNLPSNDPEYDPTFAGLSVGGMIKLLLEEPTVAAYLDGFDVGKYVDTGGGVLGLDSRTVDDLTDVASDLAALKPIRPTTFSGDNLFQAIRGVLQAVAPNHTMWVQNVRESPPGGGSVRSYGILRFTDAGDRTTEKAFVYGSDPKPELQRDYSKCYSRVVVQGGLNIQPMILSLKAGDIEENFVDLPWYATNAAAKDAWTMAVWNDQDLRKVTGTAICRRPRTTAESDPMDIDYIADPTDVALTSADWLLVNPDPAEAEGELAWAADAWAQDSDNYGGHVYIKRVNGTGGEEWTTRDTISNTALTAGGTCYLQMSATLPGTDYSQFVLTARRWPGLNTYRRYRVLRTTLDGANAARRARRDFPAPLPWMTPDGNPGALQRSGISEVTVVIGGVANSAFVGFEIDRANESIIFDVPLVTLFGSSDLLAIGGAGVDGVPDEIRVLLPVAQGVLEAVAPADVSGLPVYGGTVYTEDGIQRTKTFVNPDWKSDYDQGQMTAWAGQLHKQLRDTIVEGSATRQGYDPVFGPGEYVTWSDPCWPDGTYDRQTADVRSCLIQWGHMGTVVPIVTTYRLSNKRDPYAGQEPSVFHPCMYPQPKPLEASGLAVPRFADAPAGMTGGNPDSMRQNAALKSTDSDRIAAEIQKTFGDDGIRNQLAGIDYLNDGG